MKIGMKNDIIIVDGKPMDPGAQTFVVLVIISIIVMACAVALIHFKG